VFEFASRVGIAVLWCAMVRGLREILSQEGSMLPHTILLAVGLLVCLVGFVLVFEIKEGPDPSNITGASKRRLKALWILCGLDLILFAVLHIVKQGLTWNVELAPLAIGIAFTAVGLVELRRLAATAADAAAAALTKLERWGMLGLYLAVSACFIYLLVQLPDQQVREPQKILGTTFLILIVAAAVAWLVHFFVKEKPDSLANDADPMPIITRRVLAFYLLFVGIVLGTVLWRIGSIDFSEAGLDIKTESLGLTAQSAASSSAQSGAAGPTTPNSQQPGAPPATTSPVLYKLFTQATLTAAPVVYVTAYGDHFTADSKIRFNQLEQPTVFIEPSRIQAQVDQAIVNTLDPILVDIITNKQVTSAIAMRITKTRVEENLLGWHFGLTRELQLLLLAILAGALGSFIHSLKSFGDFVGNRTLTASWFWWYITRPFLGAALAVVFYAVLRGGFMAGTAADAKAVNQFGVIAVGALVGMFADKASDKLADIFDTLFKGADNRTGKLAAPIIDSLVPATIPNGTNPPPNLRIIGDRLGTVTQVKFDNVVHAHGAVSEKEIAVPLTAQDIVAQHTFKVSVVGDNGESPTKDLPIT
jgi:hypothetical protein